MMMEERGIIGYNGIQVEHAKIDIISGLPVPQK